MQRIMQFCLHRMKLKTLTERTQWYAALKYDAHVCYEYDEEDVLGVSWVQLFVCSLHIRICIHPKYYTPSLVNVLRIFCCGICI